MSKYIRRLGHWFRGRRTTVTRDISVASADVNIPPLLDTYNRHRENSTAQMLAGSSILH